MPYSQKQWQDRIKDSQGNIIQEGTPFSAGNMNRIEQGVADAHAQLEGAGRAIQTLQHGLSVLNGNNNAPVDIQIEGRTLVSMGSTPLDPLKNYVLADKRTKLKFTNNTYQGVAKLTGENGKPVITRIANFEGKVGGSNLENPHNSGFAAAGVASQTLISPSSALGYITQSVFDNFKSLNGVIHPISRTAVGEMAQHTFSFDIIQEIERFLGRIPRSTLADKVQWCKDNITRLTCNWHGYGSSVGGNKSSITFYHTTNGWNENVNSHTSGNVNKLTVFSAAPTVRIDSNGFVHLLAYSEPSDGVTASTINTDYVELEIELKQDAVLHDPCLPLYEVDSTDYAKILVDWNEAEVLNRYPKVQGMQHLQNPVVMAEGANLLPPFSELAAVSAFVTLNHLESYKITGSTNTVFGNMHHSIPVIPNTNYTLSANHDCNIGVYNSDGSATIVGYTTSQSVTFNSGANTTIRIYFRFPNVGTTYNISNPILTLGSVAKPFVPRNISYLYGQFKLGRIGTAKDRLYKDGQDWKVRKEIEKDVVLDNLQSWASHLNQTGAKTFKIADAFGLSTSNDVSAYKVTDYKGRLMKNAATVSDNTQSDTAWFGNVTATAGIADLLVTVSSADTGLNDTYIPTSDEIKAYFNGWKVKTADGSNKPTAWVSVVDGTDAPTQTLAYVSANKAPNYTPYKLSYALATPQTIVVNDKVEGDISVNGLTQVEVSSGVILREKATPVLEGNGNFYSLNNTLFPTSQLKNKVFKIIDVFKNGIKDTSKWTRVVGNANAYGLERLTIPKADFDSTAEYTVTYLAYDREKLTANAVNVLATYANNIRDALDDNTKRTEDNTTNISIHAMLLYDVIKRLKAGGM